MCTVACDNNYKSCPGSSECISKSACCADSDCTSGGTGTKGTCNTSSHSCSYACDSSHKTCSGSSACIPSSGCCSDSDCPINTSPVCNTSTHSCEKRQAGAACVLGSECAGGVCKGCYRDRDGDKYGDIWYPSSGSYCDNKCPSVGGTPYVMNGDDCQDANSAVHPGADFQSTSFTTDPLDLRAVAQWDWDGDGFAVRKYTTASSVGAGCTSTSCDANGACFLAYATVQPVQTCGGTVYPQSGCYKTTSSGGSCGCNGIGVQSGLQMCH